MHLKAGRGGLISPTLPPPVTAKHRVVNSRCALADFDAGRLERGAVHGHVEDVSVGGAVLHLPDDVRQLHTVQSSGRHSRRRILQRSIQTRFSYSLHALMLISCKYWYQLQHWR